MAAVVKLEVITVEPPKVTWPVVSESTTLAAVKAVGELTPAELVTVTVFNAVVWPTLVKVI